MPITKKIAGQLKAAYEIENNSHDDMNLQMIGYNQALVGEQQSLGSPKIKAALPCADRASHDHCHCLKQKGCYC